jgi:hypothetical protein
MTRASETGEADGHQVAVGRQTPFEPDGVEGPSPFPPIAEYAFLSDCETNALVAPSGNVEWLCSPRPDGRSVFASMLDRAAGGFRFGPTGVMVPAGRRYLPGTLVLETTWRARGGWLVVRDAMCIGPWYHQQRRSGTHRRPPTDYEAEHILLRTVKCIIGNVELSLDCEPVFDYGRTEATWEYSGQGYGEAIAHGGEGDVQLRLVTDLRVGFEGRGAHARTTLREGGRAFAALCWPRSQWSASEEYWAERAPPANADEAFERMERTAEYWRGWINQGVFPEHPQGAHLCPHRGAAGRGHHLAARDPRRRAQLRLPLHLDPRRHLHALGPLHPGVRARGQRLLLLRGRRLRRGGRAADHVRGRRRAGAARAGARAPQRL